MNTKQSILHYYSSSYVSFVLWIMYACFFVAMPKVKDKRYTTVKNLMMGGYITNFSQILDQIPKTVIFSDLGMHYLTFEKVIQNPALLSCEAAFKLASLIDIDGMVILQLIYNEVIVEKKVKRKK